MSTPAKGLDAKLYLNGTLIVKLIGIDFDWKKNTLEHAPLGTHVVTQVLQDVTYYSGAYRKAYVDNNYLNFFVDNTILTAHIVPRTGERIVGSLTITGGSLQSMEAEQTTAVVEEDAFLLYCVTFSETDFSDGAFSDSFDII